MNANPEARTTPGENGTSGDLVTTLAELAALAGLGGAVVAAGFRLPGAGYPWPPDLPGALATLVLHSVGPLLALLGTRGRPSLLALGAALCALAAVPAVPLDVGEVVTPARPAALLWVLPAAALTVAAWRLRPRPVDPDAVVRASFLAVTAVFAVGAGYVLVHEKAEAPCMALVDDPVLGAVRREAYEATTPDGRRAVRPIGLGSGQPVLAAACRPDVVTRGEAGSGSAVAVAGGVVAATSARRRPDATPRQRQLYDRRHLLPRMLLGAATLASAVSMGGGFLALPLLVPLHLWAARTARSWLARIWWLAAATAGVAVVVWLVSELPG